MLIVYLNSIHIVFVNMISQLVILHRYIVYQIGPKYQLYTIVRLKKEGASKYI